MGKKIGIGIIGLNMGRYHLHGYLSHPDKCKVVGLSDINRSRLDETGKKYTISFCTTDYQKLLKCKDIDAISIATPNYLHSQIAIEALNRGKHVLVEKPMAISIKEAEKMVKAANKSKCILMVEQCFRFRDDVQYLKKIVESRKLGRIYFCKVGYVRQQLFTPSMYFLQKKMAGGGALLDVGVHTLDLGWWLMGSPEPISVSGATGRHFAQYTAIPKKMDVEDMAVGLIRFKGDITLSLEAHWASYSPHKGDYLYVSILGDKGGIAWPQMKFSIKNGDRFVTQKLQPEDRDWNISWNGSIARAIGHFLGCINSGKRPIASGQECIGVIKIISALYRSAKKGKEINISKLDRPK